MGILLRSFDYVYYRICRWYMNQNDSSPGITALIIISLLQFVNAFSLFILLCLALKIHPTLSRVVPVISTITLLVLNGFRYNSLNYEVLSNRWANEDTLQGKRNGNKVRLYVLLSFLLVATLILSTMPWK
jgi:hypothetical protein